MNREIIPADQLQAKVQLSGSKYLANRWVVLAALASQPVVLNNVVNNDDINTAIKGLNALGYRLVQQDGATIMSLPREQKLDRGVEVYTAHSGTFSRFVAAVAALDAVPIYLFGSDKMNSRPMEGIFSALRDLGVAIESEDDTLPATITGPVKVLECSIDGSISSQYISALLLVAPKLADDFVLTITGDAVSTHYIDMTIDLMRQLGVKVDVTGKQYRVKGAQDYRGGEFTIAPDPVSSSYFMGAAAICGGEVILNHFDFASLQGEAKFYHCLQQMGCDIQRNGQQMIIRREQQSLIGQTFDMGEMPDVVQTLASVACFAQGTTVMKNIAHLAFKESNRIVDTATELAKLGAKVEYGRDYLAVTGGELVGTRLKTYDDHRMAMSLALIGAKVPGVVIEDADVVSKSFPNYFDTLATVGIQSKIVP